MKYRIILGENVLKYRKIKGLSQEDLAERASLHRTYIGAIERGERNITIDTIEKIANALQVSVIELLSGGN